MPAKPAATKTVDPPVDPSVDPPVVPSVDDEHNDEQDENQLDGLVQRWQAFTANGTPYGVKFSKPRLALEELKAAALLGGYVAPVYVPDRNED